jgi:BCD family chlorophyll transporter-like MFS transporter
VWKQEARGRSSVTSGSARDPSFQEAWQSFISGAYALRRLTAVGIGTLAFTMQDVMLEPYGGQVLGMSVSGTTKLTAAMALGTLIGFGLASRVLARGADPFRMASYGALAGIPAFAAVILAGPLGSPALFFAGTGIIGFGAGLFSHGTLTATMNFAPSGQRGLALGAWGAVQATAAGLGIALGGIVRDVALISAPSASAGYASVYVIEVILLCAALVTMFRLIKRPAALAGGRA